MEFIEFLQDRWSVVMIISAIYSSLTLCIYTFLNITINEFKDGNYVNFYINLMLFVYFGISLISLLIL